MPLNQNRTPTVTLPYPTPALQVYCNILEDNEYCGIKVMVEGSKICQNIISGKGHKVRPSVRPLRRPPLPTRGF